MLGIILKHHILKGLLPVSDVAQLVQLQKGQRRSLPSFARSICCLGCYKRVRRALAQEMQERYLGFSSLAFHRVKKYPRRMQQCSICGKLSGIGSSIHACMKIERHGQVKILTQQEIELLFNKNLQTSRDRTLFGLCLYTACRIAETCSLKVINVFTPANVIRSEMIIRFRQHQRQARHPHYPDHSRVKAAVRNLRTSRAPLSVPQPPPQPPLETREPRSRLSSVPRSLRKSWHHRRFHPQPQKVGTHSDEQRRDSAADYSRNQRPQQPRTVAALLRSAARPSKGSRLCTLYPFLSQEK